MDEEKKMIFDELVNEVNFLECRVKDAIEIIYAKLERLRDLDALVEQDAPSDEQQIKKELDKNY